MHRQLSFDFEASRHGGEGFDVTARKNLVARQHIGELPAENVSHHCGQDVIPEAMTSSVGFHALRHSRAIDEVEIFVDRSANHARGSLGFIGRVAVDQHVDVGIDVGEHATDDISLSLTRLVANNRACGFSNVNGAIVIAHVPLSVVTLGWGAGYLRG